VPCGPRVRFTGAVAGVSPGGRVLAALQATDGRWLQWDARGAPRPLPARVIQRGQPRAAFWVDEALAVLVMAEPEFGLTWHEMPFIME